MLDLSMKEELNYISQKCEISH